MNATVRLLIGGLAVLVVGLGVALGIVLATDDDNMMYRGTHMDGDNPYQGMMGAMSSMDSDDMLAHMRAVLGDDDYQRMLEHMAEHRAGGMMGTDPQIDGMMHQMMDGMMQQMPDDANNRMPTGGRSRGQSPAAQATPAP